MFKKYRFYVFLFFVVVLAAFFRLPYLNTFPPAMIQDEVGIGYSAISIAETGMDEWGIKYPLVFKSFGDYKAPAFIYATALLYKIIGWNQVLPRITSALAGIFIVFLGGISVRKMFKSGEVGLIAALILAVSPWAIHLSRMALESNLGLAFFTAGLTFMTYANKSKLNLALSSIFFALSTYTFHSFRYTVVIFLVSLIGAHILMKSLKFKPNIFSIKTTVLILIFSSLLSMPGFLSKGATNRLDQTLLLTSEKQIRLYEHYENNCHNTFIKLNPKLTIVCRLKYNKYSRMVLIGTDSLLKHLSPGFYFFSGDTEPIRNPTGTGQFFAWLLPVWMIGSILMLKKFKDFYPVIIGFFVALLPSTVSGDPHATRLSVVIPFFLIIFSLGYLSLRKFFKKYTYFPYIFALLLFVSGSMYMAQYASDTYAKHEITGTYLSFAKKIAILSHEYIQKGYLVYADHDLYPEPHMYYAYWNNIDPKITQESFAAVYEESEGFTRPKKFGENLYFEEGSLNNQECEESEKMQTVFITNDEKPNRVPVKIIKDNTDLYNLVYVYEMGMLCREK